MPRLVLIGALLVAVSGCKSLERGAREQFSRQFSCPENRFEVRARDDLRVWDVLVGTTPEPPAEVRADPERLATYRATKAEEAERMEDSCELFEAIGCGHRQLYCCAHPSNGSDELLYEVGCVPGRDPSER